MRFVDIINKKRNKQELTNEEIQFFVDGVTDGSLPDYQISALLMAIVLNDMNERETAYLAKAMMNSGDVIDLTSIEGIKSDKHSTGGVGDKITLMFLPLMAAADLYTAKLSGRGLGHTGGTATCEEKAICEECGLPYGNLLSHRFDTWVSEVPATCEEDGVKAHKYCSLCEKNYDEHGNVIVSLVISAKGHKLGDLVTKVEPTCVDDGMKAHYQCLTCSEYFDTNKVKVDELELVIPAYGHNLTFNALVPATCENVGKLAHYHCSSCGKDYEDNEATTELTNLVIEALGHSYGEWVPAKAATCEDAGNVGYFQCSECDKYFDINRNELTSVVIDALGHSYGTTLVGKDKIHHGYKCSTCGEFNAETIGDHDFNIDEPTIEQAKQCNDCGYVAAPALNHDEHICGVATCTSKAICTGCGKEYGDLNPNNHAKFPVS